MTPGKRDAFLTHQNAVMSIFKGYTPSCANNVVGFVSVFTEITSPNWQIRQMSEFSENEKMMKVLSHSVSQRSRLIPSQSRIRTSMTQISCPVKQTLFCYFLHIVQFGLATHFLLYSWKYHLFMTYSNTIEGHSLPLAFFAKKRNTFSVKSSILNVSLSVW